MRNKGFTTIEMVIVVVLMGVIAAMAFPRIRGALDRQNVRSARAAAQTFVVKARAAAVQRGCRGTLHLPADGRMWVTVCRLVPAGGSTRDTLGPIETLAARYNVTILPSRDSVAFDARGLKINFERVTIAFTHGSITDSLVVNELGKVVRQ
jgi:prepilin-type N-terminal cleavage/methylation domain-containing protein